MRRGRTETPSSRSSTSSEDRRVLVGEVVRAHGIKGDVIVDVTSDAPGRYAPGSKVFLRDEAVTIRSSTPHQGRLIVSFEGISDRNQAEDLRGELLFVDVDELPELESDEWWEKDLIGATVVDLSGNVIGEMTEVIKGPEQDLWKITGDAAHFLIPAVKEIVKSVNVESRTIEIDPPEGLIE